MPEYDFAARVDADFFDHPVVERLGEPEPDAFVNGQFFFHNAPNFAYRDAPMRSLPWRRDCKSAHGPDADRRVRRTTKLG